ncbi:MAG: hypothetical protein SFV32_12435 [Opitutaceae bacterium]|nr:hypothetical protein [Opitutaceae bacterium]
MSECTSAPAAMAAGASVRQRESIIEGPEPYKRDWVGRMIEFDLHRKSRVSREQGVVHDQRWLGYTQRGRIPEYELVVVGKSGMSVRVRVTEDHVRIIET